MTTKKNSVTIYVEWTGSGSITANGAKLKNDIMTENMVTATAGGSVVLTSTGDAQLIHLKCSDNYLTALDVTKCTKLKELGYSDNSLTTLDVSACMELAELFCGNNLLTALDVSNCTALDGLYCEKNP